MKHFIVEITYLIPFDQMGEAVAAHRAFLDGGYASGMLLFSGPQNPKVGGMVVARAEKLDALRAFFEQDPYNRRGLATYRFVEFEPAKKQAFLDGWVSGK